MDKVNINYGWTAKLINENREERENHRTGGGGTWTVINIGNQHFFHSLAYTLSFRPNQLVQNLQKG